MGRSLLSYSLLGGQLLCAQFLHESCGLSLTHRTKVLTSLHSVALTLLLRIPVRLSTVQSLETVSSVVNGLLKIIPLTSIAVTRLAGPHSTSLACLETHPL
jgi:hypothetical protein